MNGNQSEQFFFKQLMDFTEADWSAQQSQDKPLA